MRQRRPITTTTLPALAAIAAALALSGCATTGVDTQWRSVELPAAYLRGATVLVVCEAADFPLQRLCEDRLAGELGARGVRAVIAPPVPALTSPGAADAASLAAARANGARAIVGASVGLASQLVSPPFSLGIGGFGFGRHSAVGVGVSAPIGSAQLGVGYGWNARVTDVASGRLMWTARAGASPASDVSTQFADLSRSVADAAAGAGLF